MLKLWLPTVRGVGDLSADSGRNSTVPFNSKTAGRVPIRPAIWNLSCAAAFLLGPDLRSRRLAANHFGSARSLALQKWTLRFRTVKAWARDTLNKRSS